MRINSKLLLLLACVALVLATPVWADVPENMNVQGRLTDAAGDPLAPGFKSFTFKIFDMEVGGAEIWPAAPGETQVLSTDDDGLWTARVGELIALTEAVFQDTSRWLEVTVDDGVNPAETMPRIKLNTNPYSYRSASAQQADDADLLGGLNAGSFALSGHNHDATDITSGTLNTARYSANSDLGAEGFLDNNAGTDLLNRNQGDTRWMGISTDDWVNTTGDLMTGNLDWNSGGLSHRVDIGSHHWRTYKASGEVAASMGGTILGRLELDWEGTRRIELGGFSDQGHMRAYDTDGTRTVTIGGGSTGGGYMELDQQDGTFGMRLLGGSSTDGSRLFMYDAAGNNDIYMDADLTGNGAIIIPSSSISSGEMLNEPGIAVGRNSSFPPISSTSANQTTLITRTITIPSSGYIVCMARGWFRSSSTTGNAYCQIDETAGGGLNTGYYTIISMTDGSLGFYEAAAHRTYFKSSSGSYTFRFEASEASNLGVDLGYSSLTLMYFPTAYGGVSTIAEQGDDLSGFGSAKISSTGDPESGMAGDQMQQEIYEYDLRELELRAARAEIASLKAAKDLREAKDAAETVAGGPAASTSDSRQE